MMEQAFDEVAYFLNIAKLRYSIAVLMRKYNLIDRTELPNGALNSFHLRAAKNPQAMIAVEFSHDVLPASIATPYGALEINTADPFRELNYACLSNEDKALFMRELRQMFAMVPLQPYVKDMISENTLQSPIYGVTRFPWSKQVFSQPFWEGQPLAADLQAYQAEQKHVAEIFDQVNAVLQAQGYEKAALTLAPLTTATTVEPEPNR